MNQNEYKEHILVVDDIQLTHAIFKKILSEDYELIHAMNGVEALDILRTQEPPDLILLDIMMPEMNGYELFDHVKDDSRLAHIPIIFVTALDSEADQLKGLETGAVDYIIKPIDKLTLTARIEHCLEYTRFIKYQQAQYPEINKDFVQPETTEQPEMSSVVKIEDGPARILLVDNDPAVLKVVNEALGDEHIITRQQKGAEILAKINPSALPDLILMDVLQSGFDGFKLIKQLKENEYTQSIPVIFMTSRRSKEDESKGFELGCADYITKPLSIPILKARTRIHLQITRQRRAFEKMLDDFLNE